MKKIVLLILLLIFKFSVSQTKSETVNWLNQKFNECKSINLVNVGIQENDRDGEFLTILNHYGSFASAYNVTANDVMSVKLSQAEAGNYNIIIRSNRMRELTYDYDENRNLKFSSDKYVNEVVLVFDATYSDGTKLKKGLTHLVNLMGGNLITEDLFND